MVWQQAPAATQHIFCSLAYGARNRELVVKSGLPFAFHMLGDAQRIARRENIERVFAASTSSTVGGLEESLTLMDFGK